MARQVYNPLECYSRRTIVNSGVVLRRASEQFQTFLKALAEAREEWAWVCGESGNPADRLSFIDACDQVGAEPELLHDALLKQMPDGFAPILTASDSFLCPFIPKRRCQCLKLSTRV
jgi:hypothetical protein